MSRWLGRVARQRYAFVWAGLASLLLSCAVTAYVGAPNADSHDERSYLLAADTFAHGRLTNPPHPMWEHMETFHVLHRPSYQSKYPPGQGLMLALGKVAAGELVVGAWLSSALACAAITWALRAWAPARWALLAGMMAALHPLVLHWGHNYWGGSLAACGGALLFGAIGRMRRRVTPGAGAMLAIGASMLMVTRPYEGLALILLLLPLAPVGKLLRDRRALAACAAVMLAAAGWQGYYNYRVTGSPLLLPYVEHERQYSEAPSFVFMNPRPEKAYRHEFMRLVFHESELLRVYQPQRTIEGFARFAGMKLRELAVGYLLPAVLTVGLAGLLWAWWRGRNRWVVRMATIAVTAFAGLMMMTNWLFPHYAAPGLVVLFFLEVAGLRYLLARRWGWRVAVPVLLAASMAVAWVWVDRRAQWAEGSWGRSRDALVAEIERQPGGPHLVIVRYQYINNLNHDWIANAAEIDASPVVWARDMGEERNRELLRYFGNRRAWLMTVVGDDAAVTPYGASP